MNHDELTSEEKRALASLPREREPQPALEERTVNALRERGILGRRPGIQLVITPARAGWMAAAAAGLILFGFGLGQLNGQRRAPGILSPVTGENGLRLAAFVQQSGSVYVGALTELSEESHGIDPYAMRQATEAAVATLYAASDQIARLAPEEEAAQKIREAVEDVATEGDARDVGGDRVLLF